MFKVRNRILPESIREEIDMNYKGEENLYNIPSSVIIQAATTAHNPSKGIIKGLDLFEIETIRRVNPKKAVEYDKMIISKSNQRNILNDKMFVIEAFITAIEVYMKANRSKGNDITRLFMSEETKEQRDLEEQIAIRQYYVVEKLYLLQKENVVSYRTIKAWEKSKQKYEEINNMF